MTGTDYVTAVVHCPFCAERHDVTLSRWSVVPVVVFCDGGDGGCDQAFGVSAEVAVKARIHRIEGFDGPVNELPPCPKCGSTFVRTFGEIAESELLRCGACGLHFRPGAGGER